MQRLLQAFLDIALWRKGPQDLPASTGLLAFVAIWYVGLSYVQIRLLGLGVQDSMIVAAVDVFMLFVWLALALAIFGLRPRLTQTLTALLGIGVLLALADVALRTVLLLITGSSQGPDAWMLLRLILTLILSGRIIGIALERNLLTGVALTLVMIISTEVIVGMLIELPQPANQTPNS
jgi:hypothetical protein